ncbi:hypothetical protein JAAARDRAFT_164904 [Jaapia argillacea MUCL 33604]|uniref:HTH TFE/IIEalpha-type domain-containing protein n=1 Tax=Jaapia argillacea MUCL 33604 TaxID=933084 RepID=A0A067PHA4_9AGAM|nr:hypothetical protein JAAARDRAFT_164904 [Jaapia argillacea MUCL 33604]
MSTKEEQETLRLLVQHVTRSFYDPKFVVIMDQLSRQPVLKDDELAGRMGLQAKELNKLMAVLTNDRLVCVYRQNELKEGAQRSVGKQYYYIDYQHFCNVVKWRVAEMRRIIDSGLRNELDNKGYICPQCKKSFTPLEVDKLMDFKRGMLICDVCGEELTDNEDAESVRGSQDRMQRFNRQMAFIREGLRRTEEMVLPAFDVAAWVKANLTDAEKARAAELGPNGLKIAGSGPKTEDQGVGIVMSLDKDEETRKQERDAQAAAKRQQNLMPSWHLKSTISGDLTALGIAETSRAGGAADGQGGEAGPSNDDILRGLGTARVGHKRETEVTVIESDVKVVVNHETDYYDQYYASLAASSAPSTQDTPNGLAFNDGRSDFGDEEEDVKPSVEYLDSLNEYRKRSRSNMEEDGVEVVKKVARTEERELHGVYKVGDANGIVMPAEDAFMLERTESGTVSMGEAGDDPVVHVNGDPMRFSEVTEEHQDMMTPEEYQAYYEVMQSR